jgi:uncharacterized membrane protein
MDVNVCMGRLPPVVFCAKREASLRVLAIAAIAILGILRSAYAFETLDCGGTEPFWNAKLYDTRVEFSEAGRTIDAFRRPTYGHARGSTILTVRAKRANSSFSAFVVDETCSDGMSEREYPLGIYIFLDAEAFAGCCSTLRRPPVEPH